MYIEMRVEWTTLWLGKVDGWFASTINHTMGGSCDQFILWFEFVQIWTCIEDFRLGFGLGLISSNFTHQRFFCEWISEY